MRFLVTTGVGTVIEGPLGIAKATDVDAFDSFLLEKFFPQSGIVTFVRKQYPSIFDMKA